MAHPTGEIEAEPVDRDERLGEAIESYLTLAEAGQAPEASTFAAGYPGLEEDLVAAIEGLALVQGLVGDPNGPGHRLESGRRVAGYRIVRELGRGGMGIVYEAVHVGLDRPVALKVLGSSAAPDSSGRRRFLNEARTAAGLHHTHIVPVFDVGQVGGLCYYAMQRIEGSGLDRVIKHLRRDRPVAAGSTYPGRPSTPTPVATRAAALAASGLLLGDSTATWAGLSVRSPGLQHHDDDEPTPFVPPRGSGYYRWVAAVGRQAAEALGHAHQSGVIHRDVKPSNILVDARGVVWMADFGLARRLADPSQTQLDSLLGTPRYMSPEQAKTGPIDGRTDVYSLGATLYELLTLRPPFEGRTAAELIDQIADREPPPVRQFDPKVPRDLETIVLKALHKRPGDRYETAPELAHDLERFLNHEPVRARRIGPIGRAWRLARRHPSLTIVSAAATATVIASSTMAYVRVLHERDEANKARGEAQEIAIKLEAAIGETRAALQAQYLQGASVIRMSTSPDRRARGLDLLKLASNLSPDPDQRTRLRDEAVAFLAIRDVEERPRIPVADRLHGLVFGADGGQLATLSEDGLIVRFWDADKASPIATHEFPAGSTPPPRGRGDAGPRGGFGRPWSRIAAAGKEVAVIHPDGKGVRLFNAATGAVSKNLRLFDRSATGVGPTSTDREIVGLLASTDGRRIVTIDRPADFEPGRPRGGRFDMAQGFYQVHLWDVAHPDRALASLFEPKPEAIRGEVFGAGPIPTPLVAISPDGATVALAERGDSEIVLWTRDGKGRDTIDSQTLLTALALGPEGLLAAAGNRTVHLWDLANVRPGGSGTNRLAPLAPNQGYVDQLRFSPDDGALLAISGRSGIELWDVSASARVASLAVPEDWHGLAMAPDGNRLAVGQPGAVALWAVVDPKAQTQIAGFRSRPSALAFSPDGDLAMASPFDGLLRRWTAGRCAASARTVDAILATALAYDASGRLIVQERDRVGWLDPTEEVPALRLALPESPQRLDAARPGLPPTAHTIARTPDGRTIAMTRGRDVFLGRIDAEGIPGRMIRLSMPDLPDPEPSPTDRRPPTAPGGPNGGDRGPRGGRGVWRNVAIGPAGDRIYLASVLNDEVSVWAVRGDRLERLPWALPGHPNRLALSTDGATLAVGDRSGLILLVDTATGLVRRRLALPEGDKAAPIESLAFAPDGRELAVGSGDQVRLWSLIGARATPFVRLPGHRGMVSALAYAPTGTTLAAGDDRTVKVWDLARVRSELAGLGLE